MKKIITLLIIMLGTAFWQTSLRAQSLTVNLAGPAEIRGSVENMTDNILVNIVNTSTQDVEAYFVLTLTGSTTSGPVSITNVNGARNYVIDVEPGARSYNVTRMIEEFQNASIQDFDISPASIVNQIRLTRSLPSGNYNFCVEARDPVSGQLISTPGSNNCHSFSVAYRNPPEIQTPMHDSWVIDNDGNSINFSWMVANYSMVNDRFTVELVRFRDVQEATDFISQGRPQSQFPQRFEPIMYEEDISGLNFNSMSSGMLPELNVGDILGVRVTVVNEDDMFLNNGNSNIHIFTYGVPAVNPCDNPVFFANTVYPSAGDTIPFKDLFYIMKFDPSCDNLSGLEAKITYNRMLDGVSLGSVSGGTSDNWKNGPGPKNFLNKYFNRKFPGELDFFFPPGSDVETYIPLLNNNKTFDAGRGESVSMSADVTLKFNVGSRSSQQMVSLSALSDQPSVIGMPRPVLHSPANDAVLEPGSVSFSFKTGEKPSNPLPPFKVFRIEGSKDPIVPGLYVREKLVLQVSTEPTFQSENIVFCQLKKIQNEPYNNATSFDEDNPNFESFSETFDRTPERKFDENHFTSNVYKDLTISADLNQADTLYWRVVWLKDPENFNNVSPCQGGAAITDNDIYHASEVRRLVIEGTGEPIVKKEPEKEELVDAECGAPCVFPVITDETAGEFVEIGETITVAGFSMEVTQISGGNGKGLITIPFLRNAKLKVDFTGLIANAERQMIGGTINPEVAATTTLNSHLSDFGKSISMTEYDAEDMEAAMEAGGRLLSLLQPGAEVSLPIGIDNEIDGNKIILGITSMTFEKDSAHLDLVANLTIPTLDELGGFISMGAQVCMTNQGLANDVKLYLPQDQIINMENDNQFRINGAAGRTGELDVTSVEWDCNGFKALHLAGAMKFTREWMVPEDAQGKALETGQVEARFGSRFTSLNDIIVRLEMDRFQLPDADGWSFSPGNNIWIDLSDVQNPGTLNASLPKDYVHAAFSGSGMENTWKGFYLKDLNVETPEFLNDDKGKRIKFSMEDMLIDNSGISFALNVVNLLRWEQNGDMNGWKASLDTVAMHVVQSSFRDYGFSGKLGLPIADETQFMRYQAAIVNTEDDFNMVVSVKPADELKIPISMANAVINRGTYVELVVGEESYIEANLCATLTIDNSYLPGGSIIASKIELPGICVQNLKIHSENGFDNSEFAYSLTANCSDAGGANSDGSGRGGRGGPNYVNWADMAPDESEQSGSNEGTMSGFPITLESLSFSNDKVTIEPRITLTGGENGFSAKAKVSVLFDMNLLSKPQHFTFTGVELDQISVDIETSEIKLAGNLEFYKTGLDEGIRGGVLMEINLGSSVGVNINADFGTRKEPGARKFNTKQWFSYFYVDGVGVFSDGIEILDGVSLFGLGGGFYHHMTMSGKIPDGKDVAGATTSGAPTGITYVPNYDTDLGLKFMVLIGSSDMGRAYNVDATLEASFSFSHGLELLQLTGTFRAATEGVSVTTVGREGDSPLAGYVRLTLNTPAHQPATFDGQFFVKLKMPAQKPILTGLGNLSQVPPNWTADNAMVWATFYAGPDKWLFHMGTPDNRSGVSLKMGDSELARVTAYLMLGHDIPVVLPEPDAEFIRIFNQGMSNSSSFRGGGDVTTLMEGQPRPPMPLGQGIATGLTMVLNTGDVNFFPFFYNLKAVIGADINMTYAGPDANRHCAGTSTSPGVDGWYAMGQFYAGIEGTFGINIDLYFEEIKVNILKASAAMIMQGGLPNPEWVQGRGSFYYNVCDGLAEGTCHFEVSAGDVCLPVTGDPFSDITLIQDVTPAGGETQVSIYTKASAAFSMNMARVIEFQEFVSATRPPVTRRIQPYMADFKIVESGKSAGVNIQDREWSENFHISTILPAERLAPNKKHTVTVEARLRENGQDVKKANGQVFREVRTQTFTTGPEPDYIDDNNLAFTYPYINQQNFFKGETSFGQAFIRTRQGGNSFLNEKGSGYTTYFYARFSTPGEESFTVPARLITGKYKLIFNVSQLKNDKIYCVQFIREDKPVQSDPLSTLGYGGGNQQLSVEVPDGLKIVNLMKTIGESTVKSNQYKKITLPSENVGEHETQLYSYYFKTSKYDTMAQKLQAEGNWDVQKYSGSFDSYELNNDLDESFETFDVNDFSVVSGGKTFTSRIKFRWQLPAQSSYRPSPAIPVSTLPVNAYMQYVIYPKLDKDAITSKSMANTVISRVSSQGYNTSRVASITYAVDYPAIMQRVGIGANSGILSPLSRSVVVDAFNQPQSVSGVRTPGGLAGVYTSSNTSYTPNLYGSNTLVSGATTIYFRPAITAVGEYKRYRNQLVDFYNSSVTKKINFTNMVETRAISSLMTSVERANYLNQINRSGTQQQYSYVDFRKQREVQYFGIQYVYPDALGNDQFGSVYRMQFTSTP